MELKESVVTRLLDAIAEEKDDAVAENVLVIVRRMDDGSLRRELLSAVADGLGVPLD